MPKKSTKKTAFSKPRKSGEKAVPTGVPFVPGDKRAGRPPGCKNKVTLEVREAARALVEDTEYRELLQRRLLTGTCSPQVETMLWHYAYGKPKESVELTGPNGAPLESTPQIVVYIPDNGRDRVSTNSQPEGPPKRDDDPAK